MKTINTMSVKSNGFTMLEVVIVIAVIAILAGLIAPLAVNTIKQSRVNACWEELQVIKKAIVGEPAWVETGSRSSFGFVGDVGTIPGDLQELITRAATRPTYHQDTSTGMFFGWRGPYISDRLDPWGRNYNYLVRNATDTDKTIVYIWSSGSDGQTAADPTSTVAMNTDNIRISINQDEAFSMICGNTLDRCGAGSTCSNIIVNAPTGALNPNDIFTTTPALTTTTTNPIYTTGYSLFPFTTPATRLYPIGIRRISFTTGGINYAFLITINNGPITTVHFREPGTCPN